MNSFLILSSNTEFIDNKINQFIVEKNISAFDVMTVPNDLSLGIDTIKKLIRDSSIKALSGKRLIVLNNFNTATIEAQNALLKFLEDSKNQIILISAKN